MKFVSEMHIPDAALIGLAPGVTMVGAVVEDGGTGVRHTLNATAVDAFELLGSDITPGQTYEILADRYQVGIEQVREDLLALFTYLDRYDLLVVDQRRLRSKFVRDLGWHVLHPSAIVWNAFIWFTSPPRTRPGRRYPPTTRGVIRAVVRGQAAVLLSALLAIIALMLFAAAAFAPARNASTLTEYSGNVSRLVGAVLILCVLTAAHELGHLLCATLLRGPQPLYIARRGMTVSVMHKAGTHGQEALIALYGPLSALLVGSVLASALHYFAHQSIGFVVSLASVTAALTLVHLTSLLPWTADGRAIWSPGPFGKSAPNHVEISGSPLQRIT